MVLVSVMHVLLCRLKSAHDISISSITYVNTLASFLNVHLQNGKSKWSVLGQLLTLQQQASTRLPEGGSIFACMCETAGTPLAPPPSDATKPKIPSGPDLRVPGPPGANAPSLGAAPQLASAGLPPSPAKAADKASKKVAFLGADCTASVIVQLPAWLVTHT